LEVLNDKSRYLKNAKRNETNRRKLTGQSVTTENVHERTHLRCLVLNPCKPSTNATEITGIRGGLRVFSDIPYMKV
ncbi:MAG: hypothetical protein WAU54_05580, partial [Chania sp.]